MARYHLCASKKLQAIGASTIPLFRPCVVRVPFRRRRECFQSVIFGWCWNGQRPSCKSRGRRNRQSKKSDTTVLKKNSVFDVRNGFFCPSNSERNDKLGVAAWIWFSYVV